MVRDEGCFAGHIDNARKGMGPMSIYRCSSCEREFSQWSSYNCGFCLNNKWTLMTEPELVKLLNQTEVPEPKVKK
jgi:hypothetical protein